MNFHLADIKKCPVCLEEFTGRKNQIYCSINCKSRYNNKKAFELRTELVDNKVMLKNYRILHKFYEISKGANPIEIKEFFKEGFEFECPTRKVKSPIDGFEFNVIHKYAYRIINKEDKQFIAICKKDDIKYL